jgi:YYY domain-containing protein
MSFAMQPAVTPSPASQRVPAASVWLTRARLLMLLPFLIAAVALGLRLQGIDWDGGNFYHPDERSIYLRAEQMYDTLTDAPGWEANRNRDFPLDEPGIPGVRTFFDKDTSPLNPHWFPLGTIIIYILVAVRGLILEPLMDQVRLQDLASAGRTIAAIVDTGSVLMLYYLGRRLFGPAVGLLASAFGAFLVLNIQVAHFYRPESFVILLALASFWWMMNVLERGSARDHALLGLMVGLSFAFRASGAPLLIPVLATYGVLAWRRWDAVQELSPWARLAPVAKRAAMAGAISFVTFAILQPYALLDYTKFFGDLGWETGIARTAGTVPYTVQYVDTARNGWYELRQSAVWAFGLPLGIVAWGGLAISTVVVFFRRRTGEMLLLAWVIPLLLIIATFEVKFLRYIAPVLPIMALLGARWLVAWYVWAKERRSAVHARVAAGVIGFVVVATVWYALAFVGIYGEDHPGVQASDWINENAERGSIILTDNHWDEGFGNLGRFTIGQLPMYEGDTLAKVQRVSIQLGGADYIMAYSNRPWGSIARLPERYPYSSNYYQALFSGELGYELVQAFARYPEFAGVSFAHDPFSRAGVTAPSQLPGVETASFNFNLGWADENVTNYDHPLVLVWENKGRLSRSEIELIMRGPGGPPAAERALLTSDDFATQRAGGTWSSIFSESGLNGAAPWLVWLVALEVIFLVTLPIAVRTMRWLPDRGVVLARPLGLLLVSWIVWMGASTGGWDFGRGSVVLSILIVATLSAVLSRGRERVMVAHVRRHWRYLVSVEVLFVVAFLVFVMIRAANPDLWHPFRGGEKPMDLAYLTAVVKSTTFPPYDPWYAGGIINYYYFGFVLVASLIRLTGIVPAVAYNLAVPMFFALTLSAAFSVGYNLTEGLRRRMKLRVSARSTLAAGAATAMLVAILANLDGAGQLLQATGRTASGESFGSFDFWRSSRLMPGQISITEFPFWSFLFGDLHAHMISLPFQVLTIGLALNLVLSAGSPVRMVRRVPAIGGMALVVGSLAAINTWDVPAYALLGVGAIGIVVLVSHRGALRLTVLGKWLIWSAAFWAALYLLFLPFHQNYEAPFAGLRTSQWRTVAWHYMAIHGILFFLAASWIGVESYRNLLVRPRLSPRPGAMPADALGRRSLLGSRRLTAVLVAMALALALAVWVTVPALHQWTTAAVLALFVAMSAALALWWGAHRGRAETPLQMLLLAMAVLALGVGIGVDLVTAERDIDRMNTVFKFYLNAWVLYGVVGGAGAWQLWASGALRLRGVGRWRYPRGAWLALLIVLVASSAVFPMLGTRARIADRFDNGIGLTLDGTAYQQTAEYHDPGPGNRGDDPGARYALWPDAEALEYIRQNIDGSPVFLEAVTDQYRWTPRVSQYTGNPVVVGWQWHQSQQRGDGGAQPAAVNRRIADVRTMYRTTDVAQFTRLLAKYEVAYVYLGSTERLYFPGEGIAKFDAMVGTVLQVIFTNGEATVYRVLATDGEPT